MVVIYLLDPVIPLLYMVILLLHLVTHLLHQVSPLLHLAIHQQHLVFLLLEVIPRHSLVSPVVVVRNVFSIIKIPYNIIMSNTNMDIAGYFVVTSRRSCSWLHVIGIAWKILESTYPCWWCHNSMQSEIYLDSNGIWVSEINLASVRA